MALLHMMLFGCPRVCSNPDGAEIKLTRVIQTLLAYLLLQRQRIHSREVLAGLFWGDNRQERARACLNTALWRLRTALEAQTSPDAPYLVMSQQGEIGFNANSSYWLDVEVFEELLDKLPSRSPGALDEGQIQYAEQAVELYRGELMEGYYEDWVLRERERLRNRYLSSLIFLMSAYQYQGNLEASLACGKRILDQEPLREEVHRAMMRLYYQSGQRVLAIRQYEMCRSVLQEELAITPMPETDRLFRQIVQNGGSDSIQTEPGRQDFAAVEPHNLANQARISEWIYSITQATQSGTSPISLEMIKLRQALVQLDQAQQLSDAAREQFNQAIQILQKLVDPKI